MSELHRLGVPTTMRRRSRIDGSIATSELAEARGLEGTALSTRIDVDPIEHDVSHVIPSGEANSTHYPDLLFADDSILERTGDIDGVPFQRVDFNAPSLASDAKELLARTEGRGTSVLILDEESSRARYASELVPLAEVGVQVIRNRRDEVCDFRRGLRRRGP